MHAYTHFIGEPAEYVLNQLVEAVLGKDKEFVAWRAEHPAPYVPMSERQRQQGKPSAAPDRQQSGGRTPAAVPAVVAG